MVHDHGAWKVGSSTLTSEMSFAGHMRKNTLQDDRSESQVNKEEW